MSFKQNLLGTIEDKILVQKVRRGSRDAYGKLYMKYLDSIYRYIYFRVNQDKFESEDLTETVFLKAWDHLTNGSFKNENFRAWIYKIAHNTVIDKYRSGSNTIVLNESIAADRDTQESDFYKKESEIELLKAVNSLPSDQKQVITLKFIEGLKNEEIAAILDKSNVAVRALQYRALKVLQKRLSLKGLNS